jgi:hypothetical protein
VQQLPDDAVVALVPGDLAAAADSHTCGGEEGVHMKLARPHRLHPRQGHPPTLPPSTPTVFRSLAFAPYITYHHVFLR